MPTFFSFVIICQGLLAVCAIRCYHDCSDTTVDDSSYCSESSDTCDYCKTIVTTHAVDESTSVVLYGRQCYSVTDFGPCYSRSENGGVDREECCDTDLCNASPPATTPVASTTVAECECATTTPTVAPKIRCYQECTDGTDAGSSTCSESNDVCDYCTTTVQAIPIDESTTIIFYGRLCHSVAELGPCYNQQEAGGANREECCDTDLCNGSPQVTSTTTSTTASVCECSTTTSTAQTMQLPENAANQIHFPNTVMTFAVMAAMLFMWYSM